MDDFKDLLSTDDGKEQMMSSLRRIQDEIGNQWQTGILKRIQEKLKKEILDADKNIQGELLIQKRCELKYVSMIIDLPFKLTNVLLYRDEDNGESDGENEDESLDTLLDDPFES